MTRKKPKLTEQTEKLLKKLKDEKTDILKNLATKRMKDIETIVSKKEGNPGRFKFFSKTGAEKADDPRYWALVNVESLKEFIKYGANKVLDQIRVRSQANTIAREEIEKIKKKTEGPDAKSVMYNLMYIAIIGVIMLVVVMNFFNYNEITTQLTQEKIHVGTVTGQLAACNSELAGYRPTPPVTPPADSTGDSGPDNVLEG